MEQGQRGSAVHAKNAASTFQIHVKTARERRREKCVERISETLISRVLLASVKEWASSFSLYIPHSTLGQSTSLSSFLLLHSSLQLIRLPFFIQFISISISTSTSIFIPHSPLFVWYSNIYMRPAENWIEMPKIPATKSKKSTTQRAADPSIRGTRGMKRKSTGDAGKKLKQQTIGKRGGKRAAMAKAKALAVKQTKRTSKLESNCSRNKAQIQKRTRTSKGILSGRQISFRESPITKNRRISP